jgi:hypothetical protein
MGIRRAIDTGLPEVQFNYIQAELDMAPAVLTVINTSTETTGPLTVSLSEPETQTRQAAVRFEVVDGAIGALGPGGSAEFEVKPALGLRVGDYPVTVTVSDAAGQYFSQRQMTFKVDYNAIIDLDEISPATVSRVYTWVPAPGNYYNIQDNVAVLVRGTTTTRHVEVTGGASAYVYLDNASITVSSNNFSPFKLSQSANVTLILKEGTNRLIKTGSNNGAGLEVNPDSNLIIEGEGAASLLADASGATSGGRAAGIGGTNLIPSLGNASITIKSGNVTAKGGHTAPAIGNYAGSLGTITIEGGTVVADGGDGGAGIGTRNGAASGTIRITGGRVTATGGQAAPGIGGGSESSWTGYIIIEGGTVEAIATAAFSPAAIGGGLGSPGGTITISGGTVTARAPHRAIGGGGSQTASVIGPSGSHTWRANTSAASDPGVGSNKTHPGEAAYARSDAHKWVFIQVHE